MSHAAWKFLFAIACCGLLASCATRGITDEERDASFRPHENMKLGGVSSREFVLRRSASLVSGSQIEVEDMKSSDQAAEVKLKLGQEKLDTGSAAPIDRRGYFVTAAHCVDGGDVYVAYLTPSNEMKFEKARVVWSGDASSIKFDFALVHVNARLDHVLKWGPDTEVGKTVLSAGVTANLTRDSAGGPELRVSMDPVGGQVTKIFTKAHGSVGYQVILHNSPVREGNSGGPLIDTEGRILGINFAIASHLREMLEPNRRVSYAIRPDVAWLKSLIEADQRSLR